MATNNKGDVELVVSAKNEATETINELVKSLEKLSKEAGGSGIASAFKKMFQSSEELVAAQNKLNEALEKSTATQKKLQEANERREADLRKQREEIDKTAVTLAKLNAKYADYAQAAKQAQTPTKALVERLGAQQDKLQSLSVAVDDAAQKLTKAQAELDQNQGVDAKATRLIEERRQKVMELGDAWRTTTQAVRAAKEVQAKRVEVRDTADASQQQAQKRLDTLREELRVAKELEAEKLKVVRESKDATDDEVKERKEAIETVNRLKSAIAEQVLVERNARNERTAANKALREQSKEVDKLVKQANRQGSAYKELTGSLKDFIREQEKLSLDRQNANITKLTASLETLQTQYAAAATKYQATQEKFNEKSGPDPKAVAKFEQLQRQIQETEQEIKEQTAVLEQMERSYAEAGASAEQLANQERELEAATDRLADEQRRLAKETGQTADETGRAGTAAAKTAKRFKAWGDDSRQALGFMQRIRSELLSIAAAYGGVYAIGGAIRSIYDASVITEKATARLTARLGDDQIQIGEELKFVSEQADRLGISYGDLLDQYTRFISAVPEGTLTLDQIKFSFTAVAEAARVAGLSVADIQGVFTALSQLAGKGINLEDLRQQLQERIPGATEALRIGLSELEGQFVSLEDVLERISNSELSGAAIVPLAIGLRRQFEKGLPTAVDTAQAAIGRFNSELFRTRQALAESGLIDTLIKGLKEVNKQMRTPEFKEGLQSFGKFLVAIIDLTVVMVKNIDAIGAAIKAIIALKLASYLKAVTSQLLLANAGAASSVLQLKAMTTWLGRARVAAALFLSALLPLAAAAYAGFAIGDYLQRQFPIVKKVGLELVVIMERTAIESRRVWDLFLNQLEGGWKSTLKSIANLMITILPKAILYTYEYVGKFVSLFSEDFGNSIENTMKGLRNSLDQSVDGMLDGLVDTSEFDKRSAEIHDAADKEIAELNRIIQSMYDDIEAKANQVSVIDPDRAKRDLDKFSGDISAILEDIDYTRIGNNAGKNITDSLLTQFRDIQRTLEEESATSLEDRLKVIATEFAEFQESLSQFSNNADNSVVELRENAAREIAAIEARAGLSREAKEKSIAAIRLRTESQISDIRSDQSKLAGAGKVVSDLVKLRQEVAIQEDNEKRAEQAEKRITEAVKDRKAELSRVNELADLGLITTEEQGRRLYEVNERSLATLREAVEQARTLAQETGNASLQKLVDSYDGFEDLEKRRAAVADLDRLEKQINDTLALRNARIETINTLRETGVMTEAEAREDTKRELQESNAVLVEMIDNAITLATTLGDTNLVENLKNMKAGLKDVRKEIVNADQMASDFASGFVSAFNAFIDGTKSMGEAFRQFAADFLRQIANMILQQIIFNAVRGFMGDAAGGINALGPSTAAVNHTGGIVGRDGARRRVNPMAFLGAMRYHAGGVAGLKPNEVPTILERGEEVLTRDDPRHRFNQKSDGQPNSVKIVNMIDSASVVSEGLNNAQGQKAIINFMRANKSQIKTVLS